MIRIGQVQRGTGSGAGQQRHRTERQTKARRGDPCCEVIPVNPLRLQPHTAERGFGGLARTVPHRRPDDQGKASAIDHGPAGGITLHCGRWPAERSIVRDVGTRYDIITSKNTLKRGYIHPSRPADPRTPVKFEPTRFSVR